MTTSAEPATEDSQQTPDTPVTGEEGIEALPAGIPEAPAEPVAVEDDVTGDEEAANGAYADDASLEAALDAYQTGLTDDLVEEEDDTEPTEESAPAVAAAPAPDAEANGQGGGGASAGEMRLILASLEEAALRGDDLTAKIDGVAADVGIVTDQLTRISCKYEMVSAEIESLLADNNSKSVLSKMFLLISSVAVAALAAFQVYTFAGLVSTQRQLNVSGRSVVENVAGLSKKMAEYDKNLTKALDASSLQAPARHAAEAAALSAENGGRKEAANAVVSVQERVNRLRNGLAERRLIRKETGDWFVFNNKKAEECIVDAEVIDLLNNAYRKSGRPLTTSTPPPPHNSLCLLKPDGKGGTEVVMTKDFVQ